MRTLFVWLVDLVRRPAAMGAHLAHLPHHAAATAIHSAYMPCPLAQLSALPSMPPTPTPVPCLQVLFYTPLGLGKLGESWSVYSWIQAAG